jgi:hypothetical protein
MHQRQLPDWHRTYRYSATSKYTGQFQNGQRHGQGKMTYADGNVYEG